MRKYFKSMLNAFLLITLFIGFNCSGTKNLRIGNERIVEKSHSKRPGWLKELSVDKGDAVYATGEISNAYDRSFGMRQAHADGMQKLMDTMKQEVTATTTQALEGANMTEADVGRYSSFAIAWISKSNHIGGVTSPESYWEKVEKIKADGSVEYYYNCYVRLKISKTDYNKALAGAYEEMLQRAREEHNRAAEETAKRLLEELKENN